MQLNWSRLFCLRWRRIIFKLTRCCCVELVRVSFKLVVEWRDNWLGVFQRWFWGVGYHPRRYSYCLFRWVCWYVMDGSLSFTLNIFIGARLELFLFVRGVEERKGSDSFFSGNILTFHAVFLFFLCVGSWFILFYMCNHLLWDNFWRSDPRDNFRRSNHNGGFICGVHTTIQRKAFIFSLRLSHWWV